MSEHEGKYASLSCRELLKLPLLMDSIVLGGSNGLDKQVSRVNIMEVPDVIDWVRPGEFLVTTGYPFRERPEALLELIPQLSARGVAALGLKTKRYMTNVPNEAIQLADRLGFPLIELPPMTAFSDVVRDVMERVLFHESRYLADLQERVQSLTRIFLEGGGMDDFLRQLGHLLGNPVVLAEGSRKLRMSSSIEDHLAKEMLENLPYDKLYEQSEAGHYLLPWGETDLRLYIARVPGRKPWSSFLILTELQQSWSPVDCLTMDRIIHVAGLEMLNHEAIQEVESKYINQFIQDWITARIVSLPDIHLRAQVCGCKLVVSPAFTIAILREQNSDRYKERVDAKMVRFDSIGNMETAIIRLNGQQVMIIAHDGKQSAVPVGEQLLKKREFKGAVLCLGKTVYSADQVSRSYEEAVKVHAISQICKLEDGILTYEKLGVYSLLYMLPDDAEVHKFTARYLEPILSYDQQYDARLVETLEAYFSSGLNMKLTSEKLFTHYNTIIYRLDKIKAIMGFNLEQADHSLQMQLAIKLHRMHAGI